MGGGCFRLHVSCSGDENRGYWATFSPAFCGPFIHLLWAWGMMPSSTPSCLPQKHYYEEGIAGMLTIIKASLLGSALMLLESCTRRPAFRGTSANVYSTQRCTGAGSTVAITEESNQGLTSCHHSRRLTLPAKAPRP